MFSLREKLSFQEHQLNYTSKQEFATRMNAFALNVI
jgi:hypothetical protein